MKRILAAAWTIPLLSALLPSAGAAPAGKEPAPPRSAPAPDGPPPPEKPSLAPSDAASWMRKDLPVPAGFTLDESRSYIDEPPEGTPKDADPTGLWTYEGQAQPGDLQAFYRAELAKRGWKPDGEEKATPAGDLVAAFKKAGEKGPRLQVTVSQHDGSTWLELKVE